jgi:ribose transport system substrate-binding protein
MRRLIPAAKSSRSPRDQIAFDGVKDFASEAYEQMKPLYVVSILSKSIDVLETLQRQSQPLTVEAISGLAGLPRSTTYRILMTLASRGKVIHSGKGFHLATKYAKSARFGVGGLSTGLAFASEVVASIEEAGRLADIEILLLDNGYDGETALKNAAEFVRQEVDLVIEYQIDHEMAPRIADLIAHSGIPLIAVDIPHPHAIYFGLDNYRVGFEAGELLADYAIAEWKGKVAWVLGLDIYKAGPIVQSRITGAFESIAMRLPSLTKDCFLRKDAQGLRESGYGVTCEFLQRHGGDGKILISAASDASALGALFAARELGREGDVAIVGQDCIDETIVELSKSGSALIGSMSYAPESYGPQLMQLGTAMLNGLPVAPYNYIQHRRVTAQAIATQKTSDII